MPAFPVERTRQPLHPLIQAALALLLFFATVAVIVWFGRIVDHVGWIEAFDSRVYQFFNLGPHPSWLDGIVSPFNFNFLPWGGTFIPSFIYFVLLFGFVWILARHRNDFWWALVGIVMAIAAAYVLFKITNAWDPRDRPFVHLPNQLTDQMRAIWVHWPTYPSGHVRDLALYTTIMSGFARELRWPFVILTLWVAYTRLYLGAHYPTDVIAGWVMGVGVGLSILILLDAVRGSLQRLPWKKTPQQVVIDV